ncbi:MAG: D-alanyl-D-alanine carboxypeptidase/D-alanyl-D-alanine endopeptidase [Candidatus Zhuqueibacterota bacterium]
MNHRLSITLLTSVLLFAACATTRNAANLPSHHLEFADQIDYLLSAPEIETAHTGILIQSAETGEILYEKNSRKLFMPASNEKIPTSAAALLNFGPEFRYLTSVYVTGAIEDSTLRGDVIVVGSGDPTLSFRFCADRDSCYIFRAWVDSLRSHGIRKIDGRIIGVDDVFDDEAIGYGWSVNNLSYAYSTQIGALMYNENEARLVIRADSLGQPIRTRVFPDLGYLDIQSRLEVSPEETDVLVERVLGTNTIVITGKIKPGDRYVENISIHNPTGYFLAGLKRELEQLGIQVIGSVTDADVLIDRGFLQQRQLLFSIQSKPFADVMAVLLKESQNLYAESFVKLLGHHFGAEGSFDEGAKVLKRTLERFGLVSDSYSYMDGSGLCRYNYISPSHLVNILRRMYVHPYGEVYRKCLTVAGVDGTLENRLKGTVAEGKIVGKTGTISNVRCLSGYAMTADGETLVFSTMFNNFLCSTSLITDIQDQICMLMVSHRRQH